ncbi:hypothetical protein P8452_17272 [Trifolium repens]|nr:hypothetical protein P8452_17272 [Trifolium repens]
MKFRAGKGFSLEELKTKLHPLVMHGFWCTTMDTEDTEVPDRCYFPCAGVTFQAHEAIFKVLNLKGFV